MKRENRKGLPTYQVSKWLNLSCNLEVEEIKKLYIDLGAPQWILCGKVFPEGENVDNEFDFWLERYAQGEVLPALVTNCSEAYGKFELSGGKFLIKPLYPIIQVKEHRIVIAHDKSIHSGVFGPGSIPFGVTFSYPQIFLDPVEKKVVEVLKTPFPNTALFKHLQKWVRNFTSPTPFMVDGKKRFEPFRVGKNSQVRSI